MLDSCLLNHVSSSDSNMLIQSKLACVQISAGMQTVMTEVPHVFQPLIALLLGAVV
jgi:hypothetical protein